MRKILAAALATTALAGCAGQPLAPPGMPTIAAIQATEAQLAAVPASDVSDFYRVGLFLAQEQCGGYFDAAVMQALKNARTSGQAQLLAGLATGLLGLAGASGAATGGIGLGATVGRQLLANQEDTTLAGSDPAAVAVLVATAQGQLIAALSDPATAADALADIYAVYRACSPAGIRAMEEEAIQAAPAHLSVVGTAPTAPGPAFAARAIRPAFAAHAPVSSAASLPLVHVR
jgi:hypothetical protein